jgi:hypothetical protein
MSHFRSMMLSWISPVLSLCAAAGGSAPWEQVPIGGGGYVLDTYFHPVTAHVYMKTDVGGIYRRDFQQASPSDSTRLASPSTNPRASPSTNPRATKWTPLLDWAGPDNSSLYSVSAVALDPTDGATLFILTGGYWRYSTCTVLSSHDAGGSWVALPASKLWNLTCGGNEGDRAVGNRMAIHPTRTDTIAVGGADGGVWVSTDGFAAKLAARVTLPAPAAPTACIPQQNASCVVRTVLWITLAPGGPVVLVAQVPALGLFASAGPDYSDATTWSFVADSGEATEINRIVPSGGAAGGEIWATCQGGGVFKGVLTAVAGGGGSGGFGAANGNAPSYRMAWSVAGALATADVPFSGIAVRDDGNDVVVMSKLSNSNQSIWRSLDAGHTFTQLNWTCTSSVQWWGANDYNTKLNAGASLSFEPVAAGATPSLWATDFFGVYQADAPADAETLAFANVETGHEEVCMNAIRAPAVGHLLSGAADVGGWLHDQGTAAWLVPL